MTRVLYVLLALSICSGATASALAQRNRSAARTPDPTPSSTPPSIDQVSTRVADVPPPPLWASKIKNPHVKYVQSAESDTYPVPAVLFLREGSSREGDWTEIREAIIYPAINKSNKPITAIVVEYFPDRPEIEVTLIWHGVGPSGITNHSSALIRRNKIGHFPPDAYLRLFQAEDQ